MLVVSNNRECKLNRFNHKYFDNKTPFECILEGFEEVKDGTYVCFSSKNNVTDLLKHTQNVLSTLQIDVTGKKGISCFKANYEDSISANHLTRDILKLTDCDFPYYWINRVPQMELFTLIKTKKILDIIRRTNEILNLTSTKQKTYHRNYSFFDADTDTDKDPRINLFSKNKLEKQRISLFMTLLLKNKVITPWSYLDGDRRVFDFIRGRFDQNIARITFDEYSTRLNIKNILPSLEFFNFIYPDFDFDSHRFQCNNCIYANKEDIALCYYSDINNRLLDNAPIIRYYCSDETCNNALESESYRLENSLNSTGYYLNECDNLKKRFRTLLNFKSMTDDENTELWKTLKKMQGERASLLYALKKKDIFINKLHNALSINKPAQSILDLQNKYNEIEREHNETVSKLKNINEKSSNAEAKIKAETIKTFDALKKVGDLEFMLDKLNKKNDKLSLDKIETDKQLEAVKLSHDSIEKELSSMEKTRFESKSEISKLVDLSKSHKATIKEMEQTITNLTERLEKARPVKNKKDISKFMQENCALGKKLGSAIKERNNLKSELDLVLKQLDDTKNENAKELDTQLSDLKSELDLVLKQLDDTKNENTKELDNANTQLSDLKSELEQLDDTKNENTKELDNVNTQLSDLKSELEQLDDTKNENAKELDNANTQLSDLKSELDLVLKQLDDTKNENAKELDNANTQLSDLKSELNLVLKQLDDTKNENAKELDTQLSDLKSELDDTNTELTKQTNDFKSKLDIVSNELDDTKNVNTELTKQIDNLKSELDMELDDTKNVKMDDLKSQLDIELCNTTELTKQMNDFKSQLDNANTELDNANTQLDNANSEFTKQIDILKSELDLVSKQLNDSNKENTRQLDILKSELDIVSKQLNDSKKENTELTKQMNDIKSGLDNANTQLDNANTQLDDLKTKPKLASKKPEVGVGVDVADTKVTRRTKVKRIPRRRKNR